MDLMLLYSSVCRSDNQILSSEYIHRNIGTAQYCLQNLEPYKALVIETKRNQKLFELKFDLRTESETDQGESEKLEERAGCSDQLECHPLESKIHPSKIESHEDTPESDTLRSTEMHSDPEIRVV